MLKDSSGQGFEVSSEMLKNIKRNELPRHSALYAGYPFLSDKWQGIKT